MQRFRSRGEREGTNLSLSEQLAQAETLKHHLAGFRAYMAAENYKKAKAIESREIKIASTLFSPHIAELAAIFTDFKVGNPEYRPDEVTIVASQEFEKEFYRFLFRLTGETLTISTHFVYENKVGIASGRFVRFEWKKTVQLSLTQTDYDAKITEFLVNRILGFQEKMRSKDYFYSTPPEMKSGKQKRE